MDEWTNGQTYRRRTKPGNNTSVVLKLKAELKINNQPTLKALKYTNMVKIQNDQKFTLVHLLLAQLTCCRIESNNIYPKWCHVTYPCF